MARKNNLIYVLLVTVLLLFSACNTDTDDAQQSGLFGKKPTTSGSSSSNTQGVTLEFSEGNPPKEMYNDQSVTFGFIFTNYQEHEITDMNIKVSGYDTSYVSGLSNSYSIAKIPKYTTQAGPGVYADLVASGVTVKNFQEKYNFNPQFDYCYTAKSNLAQQVCILSKQTNLCEVEVDKMQKSNGPLVTSIDSIINKDGGSQVRVFFTVNNKGTGKVVNTCFKEDYSNKFTVSAKLGTQVGDCHSVSGEYNIIQNKASFYCDFARSSEDSYASQITVDLSYKYEQSVKKQILVKDLNKGY